MADGQDAGDKVGKVGKQPGEPVGDVVGQQASELLMKPSPMGLAH